MIICTLRPAGFRFVGVAGSEVFRASWRLTCHAFPRMGQLAIYLSRSCAIEMLLESCVVQIPPGTANLANRSDQEPDQPLNV